MVWASARAWVVVDAFRPQQRREAVEPGVEDLGGREPEPLVRAGDLQCHGLDRARVRVAGRSEVPAGGDERRPDAGHEVGLGEELLGDQLPVVGAGPLDRLGSELVLAAGEVVVERAERGLGLVEDLLDPGAGEALPPEQLGGWRRGSGLSRCSSGHRSLRSH